MKKIINIYGLLKLCNNLRRQFIHTIPRTQLPVDSLVKCGNENIINESEKRLLKVAIIGAPNAGKSTLINQVLKRSVFPISKKVHTTRFRARGIYNEDNVQIVILDTPGLVSVSESQKYKLKNEFVTAGEDAIIEADVIGVVHDLSNHFTRQHLDTKALRLLHLYPNKESFLILNKVDTLKSKRVLLDLTKSLSHNKLRDKSSTVIQHGQLSEFSIQEIIKKKKFWDNFSEIFMISALLGTGIPELKNYLLNLAKTGEWLFPENAFTDQSPQKIIEETVRAKLLEHLPQEVPYKLEVELEYFDFEQQDRLLAVVNIRCNSSRIEHLVRGTGGSRIRVIAQEAEQSLADAFLANFYLRLFVCNKQL